MLQWLQIKVRNILKSTGGPAARRNRAILGPLRCLDRCIRSSDGHGCDPGTSGFGSGGCCGGGDDSRIDRAKQGTSSVGKGECRVLAQPPVLDVDRHAFWQVTVRAEAS